MSYAAMETVQRCISYYNIYFQNPHLPFVISKHGIDSAGLDLLP